MPKRKHGPNDSMPYVLVIIGWMIILALIMSVATLTAVIVYISVITSSSPYLIGIGYMFALGCLVGLIFMATKD